MNTLLLLLLLPLAQTAPAAPALNTVQQRELQLERLEKKFRVLQHVAKEEKTAWFERKGNWFSAQQQLLALEAARPEVTKFVVARGLDDAAADETLWLAYNLASQYAHKDGGAPALDQESILKTLEERAGLLAITTTPPGCKVFIDGLPAERLSNHRRFVAAGAREIRLERPGYKSVTQKVTVDPGGTHTLSATLERLP